uniref:Uncharacterized protein n=1 Tax=Strongyloides papillosus TaxID=174720 RepID=A0A0N5BEF6_STREA
MKPEEHPILDRDIDCDDDSVSSNKLLFAFIGFLVLFLFLQIACYYYQIYVFILSQALDFDHNDTEIINF